MLSYFKRMYAMSSAGFRRCGAVRVAFVWAVVEATALLGCGGREETTPTTIDAAVTDGGCQETCIGCCTVSNACVPYASQTQMTCSQELDPAGHPCGLCAPGFSCSGTSTGCMP